MEIRIYYVLAIKRDSNKTMNLIKLLRTITFHWTHIIFHTTQL